MHCLGSMVYQRGSRLGRVLYLIAYGLEDTNLAKQSICNNVDTLLMF